MKHWVKNALMFTCYCLDMIWWVKNDRVLLWNLDEQVLLVSGRFNVLISNTSQWIVFSIYGGKALLSMTTTTFSSLLRLWLSAALFLRSFHIKQAISKSTGISGSTISTNTSRPHTLLPPSMGHILQVTPVNHDNGISRQRNSRTCSHTNTLYSQNTQGWI